MNFKKKKKRWGGEAILNQSIYIIFYIEKILLADENIGECCQIIISQDEKCAEERHALVINVSPMEYGHCLLVPQIDSCLPQVTICLTCLVGKFKASLFILPGLCWALLNEFVA